MTKEKFDVLLIHCYIMKMETSRCAKHGKSPEPCDHLKANFHRWQLGGRKKSACIWINSHWNTNLNRLREEHVPDARITGSCLSTPRDPCRRWTRGQTTHEAWRVLRNFDNKQNSQAISQFSQVIRFDKDHLRNDKKQNGSNGGENLGQVHLLGLRRLRLGQIGKGRTRGGLFSKVGGPSMFFFNFFNRFAYRKWRFLCKRRCV